MEIVLGLVCIPLWAIVFYLREINERLKERNDDKGGE